MTDRATILKVARAIHMAKLHECSFPGHDGYTGFDAAYARQPWPEDRKEAERLLQAGQSWMDLAIAQAKAAIDAMPVTVVVEAKEAAEYTYHGDMAI